jgi:hypothetical protein
MVSPSSIALMIQSPDSPASAENTAKTVIAGSIGGKILPASYCYLSKESAIPLLDLTAEFNG